MSKKVKLRTLLIGGAFTLLFVILFSRLYWVQVVRSAALVSKVKEDQWVVDKDVAAKRGSITDRNGKMLAEDAPAFTIALIPQTIYDKHLEQDVTKGLAAILADPNVPGSASALEEKLIGLISKKKENGSFRDQVEVRNEGWKIDAETTQKVEAFIKQLQNKQSGKNASVGIALIEQHKRFYPGGKLAAQVIGYMDKEGKPIMGLEKQIDEVLRGTAGSLSYEKDRKGIELPDSQSRYRPAIDGNNVKLTIDKNIQFYIESALEKVNDLYHPKSMTAIAVDPMTMEILGMANTPTFNLNKYWEAPNSSVFMNHAVASQYEPGSTFKLVTLAGGVEEKLFDPEATYQSGSIQVPGRTLHDHNIVGWGPIKYIEGWKRSSNVAMVKVGQMLGNERFLDYIKRFGFSQKTGIDLGGEVPGRVKMYYPAEYATATYGQGLTATAIQQTAAYAAIANGGKLLTPYIIKEVTDPKSGEVIKKNEPTVVRQVVSEETAKQVGLYLEQVVADQKIGTGKNAYIEGYRIAGKTGTANFVPSGEKEYAQGKWIISFIGYAPLENPRILVSIIVDDPDLNGDYHEGGKVAAPAFKEIVSQTLRYMGIAPANTPQQVVQAAEKKAGALTPDVRDMTTDQAKGAANKVGLGIEILGQGAKVIAQSPAAGTEIAPDQRMYLLTEKGVNLPVPDLRDRSLRDALEVCSLLQLSCQSSGEGYVAEQSLEGTEGSRVLTLQLKPFDELHAGGKSGVKSTDGQNDKTVKAAAGDKASSAKPSNAKTSDAKSQESKAPVKTGSAAKDKE